jgi:hypothetical protein
MLYILVSIFATISIGGAFFGYRTYQKYRNLINAIYKLYHLWISTPFKTRMIEDFNKILDNHSDADISTIIKMVTGLSKTPSKDSVIILDNERGVVISYELSGKQYLCTMPYSRKMSLNMRQYKAELVTEHGHVDITQQPGIPYIVPAKDIGGNSIILTNLLTGQTYTYDDGAIPGYGTELIFEE